MFFGSGRCHCVPAVTQPRFSLYRTEHLLNLNCLGLLYPASHLYICKPVSTFAPRNDPSLTITFFFSIQTCLGVGCTSLLRLLLRNVVQFKNDPISPCNQFSPMTNDMVFMYYTARKRTESTTHELCKIKHRTTGS